MTATVHLVQERAGSGKTHRLLERCREVARHSAGRVLWLGPTRRHLDAFRLRVLREANLSLPGRLLTFQDFADEVVRFNDPDARPLATVQARLLVDAILTELHSAGRISHFGRVAETRGFGTSLFALLAELRRQDITPDRLARVQGAGGVKDREIARIHARYQELLQRHHLFDVEGRLTRARDLLRQGQIQPFENVRAVFVDGFRDFSAPQQEVLELLAGRVEELWLTLPDDGSEERAELFCRSRETASRWQALGASVLSTQYSVPSTPRQRLLFEDEQATESRPAGLVHIERQLFRPPRA